MFCLVLSFLLGCAECSADSVIVHPVDIDGAAVQAESVTWSVDGGDQNVVACHASEEASESGCDEISIVVSRDGEYAISVVSGARVGSGALTVTGSGVHQANDPSCDGVLEEELTVVVQ